MLSNLARRSTSYRSMRALTMATTRSRHITHLPASSRPFFSAVLNKTNNKEAQTISYGQPTPMTHPELMKKGEVTPGLPAEEFERRRSNLMKSLPEGSIVTFGI
ncbi:hypothetical protein BC941DRAFT_81423 [Chlamydoabsidia padenii]|nr:hypothetical protein BC941DRAFT_81423 [Chlamydoabsidia padenii]